MSPPSPERPDPATVAPLSWWADNALVRRIRSRRDVRVAAVLMAVSVSLLSLLACLAVYVVTGTVPQTPSDQLIALGLPFFVPLLLSPPAFVWFLGVLSELRGRSELLEQEVERRRHVEARLERLVSTDELTRLPNRRAFFNGARELRRDVTATVALLDLDHFKRINDQHGHAAGDEALRRVAGVLAAVPDGTVARLGGEEFGFLFAGRTPDDVRPVLEGVRVALYDADPSLTASIGIAAWPPGAPIDASLAAADRAMYSAKQNGRNRVEVEPYDRRATSVAPERRAP